MVTHTAGAPTLPGLRIALFSTAAGLMAAAAIVVYGFAWMRGTWPLGHPWAAVCVLSNALIAYIGAFRRRRNRAASVAVGVAVGLAVAGTAVWAYAAILP